MSSRTRLAVLGALGLGLLGFSLSEAGVNAMTRQLGRKGLTEDVFADGQGQQVRYLSGGQGPPMLLIHGFGGDGVVTWRSQAVALRKHRRLVIPDLLWFGGSSSDAPPSLTVQAQAQLALMDHLGIEEADVMGISYGGFVLLRMAQLAPHRLGKIIIVDSPGPEFSDADIGDLLQRYDADEPADIFLPETPDDIKAIMDLTFHKTPPLPGVLTRDILNNMFDENRDEQRALLADLPSNRADISPEVLAQLDEIMVVWGRHDPIFPLASGERLAEALGAELHIIEDADHGPNVEHPNDFNKAVLDFLQR